MVEKKELPEATDDTDIGVESVLTEREFAITWISSRKTTEKQWLFNDNDNTISKLRTNDLLCNINTEYVE